MTSSGVIGSLSNVMENKNTTFGKKEYQTIKK